MLLTIAEFVIALGILVFLHELGHYLVARMFNIEVEEFGIGFPPRLVRLFTLWGTEFTLNWIPFGAFVRPKGENDPEVPGGLASANPWQRLLVLLGGPVMNLMVGIILLSVLFTSIGAPDYSKVQIMSVNANSPAQVAGLKEGDILQKINGTNIISTDQLYNLIQQNLGKVVVITVARSGKVLDLQATPRKNPPPDQGALGIAMGYPTRPMTWVEAFPIAGKTAWTQISELFTLPAKLAQGAVSPDQARVVGPVGMYSMYNAVRNRDIQGAPETSNPLTAHLLNRLGLLATISIALGITNLLPIPALDGGRILFVLPEILFRRRIPAQYENMVHLIGFAALLVLMVYITTQDIIRPIQIP
jgi:regulator of sigma E protease